MSCGMSSLSVCQPIAVRTPRSAPLPALWPGTWKRVEPRNPYATTALRYGACGWSGEAMSAQACHDVLDDRVVLEAVHREVLAVAGLLEAAVRHLAHERQVVVDPHAAEAHRLRHPQRAADVARPHAAGQPVGRAVGPLERLVLVVEALDRDDRAEDLLLDHLVVLAQAVDHGRLDEEAGRVGLLAAGDDPRVIGPALEEAGHAAELTFA